MEAKFNYMIAIVMMVLICFGIFVLSQPNTIINKQLQLEDTRKQTRLAVITQQLKNTIPTFRSESYTNILAVWTDNRVRVITSPENVGPTYIYFYVNSGMIEIQTPLDRYTQNIVGYYDTSVDVIPKQIIVDGQIWKLR